MTGPATRRRARSNDAASLRIAQRETGLAVAAEAGDGRDTAFVEPELGANILLGVNCGAAFQSLVSPT